jgi:hypothetical protein
MTHRLTDLYETVKRKNPECPTYYFSKQTENPRLAFHTKQQVIRLLHHQSRTHKLKSPTVKSDDGDGVAQTR